VAAIGQRFQTLHPDVAIDVQTGGSGRGVLSAREGTADIGMASRALNRNEQDLLGFPIARDGICLVIHRANPVTSLSQQQVADIYTGKITSWREVGGRDVPIVVLNRTAGRGEVDFFTHHFKLPFTAIQARREVGDNLLCVEAVAGDPDAVVYLSLGEAERSARRGVTIKLLPIDGVPATSEEVHKGNFPLSRPLTLVTKGLPGGLAKEFIEYALSTQVADLIKEYDFIPYLD
jgi:phosphate transport system substrate-binding protein